jgi:hypothetical protein
MPRKGGAKKAYRAMTKSYGKKKGAAVFYAKANKAGTKGKSMHAKTQSYYKKGGRQR